MYIDARKLESGSLIEGDICIIGAGTAGISIAMDWLNSPYKVVLLEGGGFKYEQQMQDLYKPKLNKGQDIFPIEYTRLHYFGGTTGHWGGYCSPLDPIDFEKRAWVNHSGWPISRKDLDQYYDKSIDLFELKSTNFDINYWKDKYNELQEFPLEKDIIWNKIWQFSPPTRFGTKYKDPIIKANNIHLYTYANVTKIINNENDEVEEVVIKNHKNKTHIVKAKYFILAAGAIQNARLLLVSNSIDKNGIGNENDVVGRYFMEHIEMKISELWLNKSLSTDLYVFKDNFNTKARAELALTESIQRTKKILNGTTQMYPLIYDRAIKEKYERWKKYGNIKKDQSFMGRLKNKFLKIDEKYFSNFENGYVLATRIEQEPNFDSRISISKEKDALGMFRINYQWKVSTFDKKSLIEIHKILGQQFGLADIGRVKLIEELENVDDPLWEKSITGAWHHMGTTRMGNDPKESVVNSDCKIHNIKNLYVAGSSCFPTSGAANPTFTIVALSLRLSNHIKKIIKK